MSDYRRYFVAGGTYFFTIATYRRRPIFADTLNIVLLRKALAVMKGDQPFEINAAVILPDHMHFLWTLPSGDQAYSKRIGRMKIEFTRAFRGPLALPSNVSPSRRKHREGDVWQRRYWEHLIRDEYDFDRHFDYIHYNPVKHGLVSCPHRWTASSFHHWAKKGVYDPYWGCNCGGRNSGMFRFADIESTVGE